MEVEQVSCVRRVQTPLLRALDGGFLVVRPLHSLAMDTQCTLSVSRRPFDLTTTGGNRPIKILDYISKTVIKPSRDTPQRPLRRIPTHATD